MYGCDAAWWRHRRGLPEFKGIKIGWAGGYNAPDMLRVKIAPDTRKGGYLESLVLERGTIGGGRNSGFQAINLAVQFGAKRIVLCGYDMAGTHFYGRNRWPMAGNPTDDAFRMWRTILGNTVPVLKGLGVEVINASPASALECFPKMDLETALNGSCAP